MENIKIIKDKIKPDDLKKIAEEYYGEMVKGVADIERRIIAVGGELHADEETVLLENGSNQQDLWGFNIHFDWPRDSWLEFNSMVNIRPRQNNFSRNLEDKNLQKKIIEIVDELII
jgi:hypothetical protein